MVVQQHIGCTYLQKGFLALHRPWFSKAISTGSEPLMSEYAASFTGCVQSARITTQITSSILRQYPDVAYGWWLFLFNTYTAAIVQASALLKYPTSIMAEEIKADFDESFRVISEMEPKSRVASRALPMLRRLKARLSGAGGPSESASGTPGSRRRSTDGPQDGGSQGRWDGGSAPQHTTTNSALSDLPNYPNLGETDPRGFQAAAKPAWNPDQRFHSLNTSAFYPTAQRSFGGELGMEPVIGGAFGDFGLDLPFGEDQAGLGGPEMASMNPLYQTL